MSRARGVDVSAVQGKTIDFARLRAGGFDYVFCKGTEGATEVDGTCLPNVERARAAGLLVAGVYHVLSTQSPVVAQVANAMRLYQRHNAPIVLDFETPPPEKWIPPNTGGAILKRAVDFCDCIEEQGVACVVYTYPYFAKSLPYGDPLLQLVDRPLWLAQYGDQEHEPGEDKVPTLPAPWSDWTFWQWSGDGGLSAPGIPSVVDHDLYNGTREDLARWLGVTV